MDEGYRLRDALSAVRKAHDVTAAQQSAGEALARPVADPPEADPPEGYRAYHWAREALWEICQPGRRLIDIYVLALVGVRVFGRDTDLFGRSEDDAKSTAPELSWATDAIEQLRELPSAEADDPVLAHAIAEAMFLEPDGQPGGAPQLGTPEAASVRRAAVVKSVLTWHALHEMAELLEQPSLEDMQAHIATYMELHPDSPLASEFKAVASCLSRISARAYANLALARTPVTGQSPFGQLSPRGNPYVAKFSAVAAQVLDQVLDIVVRPTRSDTGLH